MANRVLRVCDVCEAPTDREPIRFGWGQAFYEADLCDEHGEALGDLVERIIRHARRVGDPADAPPLPSVPATRRRQRIDTAAVRAWAKGRGIEVSDKGRLPDSLLREYAAATRSA